jgi:hypothetical protein
LNSHRSSYSQTIKVLKEIAAGLDPREIKSKLYLSRYSYNYTVNRLVDNDLVEYKDHDLVPSRKGYNVLKFEQEYPDKTSNDSKLQIISSIYQMF